MSSATRPSVFSTSSASTNRERPRLRRCGLKGNEISSHYSAQTILTKQTLHLIAVIHSRTKAVEIPLRNLDRLDQFGLAQFARSDTQIFCNDLQLFDRHFHISSLSADSSKKLRLRVALASWPGLRVRIDSEHTSLFTRPLPPDHKMSGSPLDPNVRIFLRFPYRNRRASLLTI